MKALSCVIFSLVCVAVCSRAQQSNNPTLVSVATNALPTSITVDGETYEDVRWGDVTPVNVTIFHRTGIAALPLEKLPLELQKQFGYDPQKAADYRAAQQTAEAARQEALGKQRAEQAAEQQRQAKLEAEASAAKQKQASEAAATEAAEDAAAKKAADVRVKNWWDNSNATLGPVTTLYFNYADDIQTRRDGLFSATLVYTDDAGAIQYRYVAFPAAGLNFIRNAKANPTPNSWLVYGRPYAADVVNGSGAPVGDTAYWLVGLRLEFRNANNYPAW